jgi:hypothetical protein
LELLLLLLLIANKIRRKKVIDAAEKGVGGGWALNWKITPRGVRLVFSVPLRDRRLFKKRGLGKGEERKRERKREGNKSKLVCSLHLALTFFPHFLARKKQMTPAPPKNPVVSSPDLPLDGGEAVLTMPCGRVRRC